MNREDRMQHYDFHVSWDEEETGVSCSSELNLLKAENARLRMALIRIQHVSIEYQEAPHHQVARAESIATRALKGESHE